MIDIIIPSKKDSPLLQDCLSSLKTNTSRPHRVHVVEDGGSWVEAVNIGLSKCSLDNDIVLMDNDIRVMPCWLDDIDEDLKTADIIGFKLIRDKKTLDHAGCQVVFDPIRGFARFFTKNPKHTFFGIDTRGDRIKNINSYTKRKYVPHCTTSLLYVKKDVFKRIGGMNRLTKDGRYHEDFDFGFRAIYNGFRILYSPRTSIHFNAGTKRNIKQIDHLSNLNYIALHKKWLVNKSFLLFLLKNNFLKIRLGKIKLY